MHVPAIASVPELAVAISAIFCGSALQAAFGMGLGLLAVPLLALAAPAFIPGPMLFASIGLAFAMAYRDREFLDWGTLGRSLAGLAVGTAAGAMALASLSQHAARQTFGLLVLLAVLISVLGVRVRASASTLFLGSTAAGAMGTIVGMHGPMLAIVVQHEEPRRIRALLAAFFVVGYAISVAALWAAGLFGQAALIRGIALMPAVAAGGAIGPLIADRLNRRAIRMALLALAATSGLVLLRP